MEITVRSFEQCHVIDVAGEVDLNNSHRLKEVVQNMLQKRVCIFILNLNKVTHVDSSGIGALLAINAMLAHEGLAFKIVSVARPVMRVMELTKLNGILPIESNEQDAIESITGKKPSRENGGERAGSKR